LLTGGAAVAIGAAWAAPGLGEADRPNLVHLEIPIRRLPAAFDGFTIAQLSDFHYDPYFSLKPIQIGIDTVNRLKPDLIVLTGDFISMPLITTSGTVKTEIDQDMLPCADLLSQLKSSQPMLAVLGNHDHGTDPKAITGILQGHGVTVFRNQSLPIERNGGRLWLAGVDSASAHVARIDPTLKGVPANEATVLLCHEPDFADIAAKHPVDLQLSGHSHGGQILFPIVGALYYPKLARKYRRGLRKVGNTILYVNCGIGTVGVPIRRNCPPEITIITLRTGDSVPTSRVEKIGG
jgi:predicted MPP superfamily phosphohydrolase